MTVEERRAKAKIDCHTIDEICDFFKQFYDISYETDREIILKKTLNLHKSDITIRIHSFLSPNGREDHRLVHEIVMYTWAGGWSHRQKGIKLEYTYLYDKETKIFGDTYDWYIVDRSISSFIKIEKEDILMIMINFIYENEDKMYELPLPLKRQLILDKMII